MPTRLSARLAAALLAAAFSALLVLSALHHHEDEDGGHEDCFLCRLLKTQPASSPDAGDTVRAPDVAWPERAPSSPAEVGAEAPLPYLARAPPLRSA